MNSYTQNKIYKKHHIAHGILVETLPFLDYTKIIDKSTGKSIFDSLCATNEGNQQVKEVKANLLCSFSFRKPYKNYSYANKNGDNKSHGHNIRCHCCGRLGHTTPHCHIRKVEVSKEEMMWVPISFNCIKDPKDLTMVGGQKRNWSFGLVKALYGYPHYPFIFYERNRGTIQKPHVNLEILCFTYFQSLGKVCLLVLCRKNINHESSQGWRSTISSLKVWGHHELKSDKDVHEDAKYLTSPLFYHTGSSRETIP